MIDGNHLKNLRKQNNYSVDELSRIIHTSRSTIHRWERENSLSDYNDIKRLADCYGIPVREIIGNNTEIAAAFDETKNEEPRPQPAKKQLSLLKIGMITAGITLLLFLITASVTVLFIYFRPPIGDKEVSIWICTGEEIAVIISIFILSEVVITSLTIAVFYILQKRKNKK